jgi:hypothetical protein
VTLYHSHHLNAGAGGGNVIDGLLELVAIALNVLEVVAQGASNPVQPDWVQVTCVFSA